MTTAIERDDARDRIAEATRLGYWPNDWALPSLCTDAVLRLVLGVSWSTFYRLKKLRRFRDLEVQLDVVSGTRYSGLLVDHLRKRQWTHARSFGKKAG